MQMEIAMRKLLYLKLFIAMLVLSLTAVSHSLAEAKPTPNDNQQPVATSDIGGNRQSETGGLVHQKNDFLTGWLRMLDSHSQSEGEAGKTVTVVSFASRVPGDITKVLKESGGEKGLWGLALMCFLSLVSIAIGYLAIFGARRSFQKYITRLQAVQIPNDQLWSKITVSLLHLIPKFAELFIIGIVSIVFFVLTVGWISVHNKMLFQLLLGTLLITKFIVLCTRAAFSGDDPGKRLISLHTQLVTPVTKIVGSTFSIVFIALLVIRYFRELGVQGQTISWLFIVFGTLMMFSIGYQLFCMQKQVASVLKEDADQEALKMQLADYWLLPALFYLLTCWGIWVGQEFTGTAVHDGALIGSVLILPLYLGVCSIGKVVINSVVHSLNLFAVNEPAIWEQRSQGDSEQGSQQQASEDKAAEVAHKVYSFFKVFILCMLIAWLLNLWGYPVPFAQHAIRAIFESMVVLTLALVFWQYASSYIEKKIKDATPEKDGSDEDSDDEFGGAAPTGRSHTLLPMLRKVIASVLIMMVVLVVISSFGVNIGPLLAGAGVLGLAVGFGAQKLVSDVLSGFFFLLDDAFRVGEYIQAGSIKGSVEAISLRNVLLRHHLGMLQVVPHSDLGAITNFMRGGIVVKFPLEFPYDTDVDKVRKIIKKVGQAMLIEPDFCDDFILPIKSQGVNEIANSVMVIKVKFTAKPGKQFLIRREAYRRITEALNAKGIYYAHRKVIVDFPEETKHIDLSSEEAKKIAQAGAAISLEMDITQEQQQAENDSK
jgi:small-conductance mechanosensitive channel